MQCCKLFLKQGNLSVGHPQHRSDSLLLFKRRHVQIKTPNIAHVYMDDGFALSTAVNLAADVCAIEEIGKK